MNAKDELAARIMMLVHDEVKADTQRVLDLISDYKVEHTLGIEEMDFVRQVNHFLGAKKSEGICIPAATPDTTACHWKLLWLVVGLMFHNFYAYVQAIGTGS